MSREARIVIELEGGEKYTAQLARMEAQNERFAKSGAAANTDMMHFGRTVSGLAATFGAMQAGRYVFNTVKDFESLQASLKTATGSAANAKREFAWLEDFAADTPYDLSQVVNAFIRMQNMGLDPSREALESYGNTAGAMSKQLMDYVEAVADAATGEFERLKEFGIRARTEGDSIRFIFRDNETVVRNSAREIEGYLRSLGKTEFAGGMAEQMDTLTGKTSNFWDALYRLTNTTWDTSGMDSLFDSLIENATDGLDVINEMIERRGILDTAGTLMTPGGSMILSNQARQAEEQSRSATQQAEALERQVVEIEDDIERMRRLGDERPWQKNAIDAAIERYQQQIDGINAQIRNLQRVDPTNWLPTLAEKLNKPASNRPLIYRPQNQLSRDQDPTQPNPRDSEEAEKAIAKMREQIALSGELSNAERMRREIAMGLHGEMTAATERELMQGARLMDQIDAQNEARQESQALAERANDAIATRERELALMGKTTQLARLNAEIQQGTYRGYSAAHLQRMREIAAEQDATQAKIDLQRRVTEIVEKAQQDNQTALQAEERRYQAEVTALQRAVEQKLTIIGGYENARQLLENRHADKRAEIMLESARQAAQGEARELGRVEERLGAIEIATRDFGQSFEDAMVSAARTGKFAFKDMVESILADLLRLSIQKQITEPLYASMTGGSGGSGGGWLSAAGNLLGSWLGGGGGGAPTGGGVRGVMPGGLPSVSFPTGHAGAVIGEAATAMTRVDPRVFAGAPRHHTGTGGLGTDEVPFIGKKGEGVFTEAQMRKLAPVNDSASGVTINIYGVEGEPERRERTGANGAPIIDLIWPGVQQKLIADQSQGGPISKNAEQVWPGLQRGGTPR